MWIAYQGRKGHTTAECHCEALAIPTGSDAVWLGEALYDTSEMMAWVAVNTARHPVLRTLPQRYAQEGPNSQPIGAYPLDKEQVFHGNQVGFAQDATVTVNLIGWWWKR